MPSGDGRLFIDQHEQYGRAVTMARSLIFAALLLFSGGVPQAQDLTDPNTAAPGNPAAGEAVFFGVGGCATCHEVNGRGGVVGPDLSGAGRQSAAALRQKIVDPNNLLAAPPAAGRDHPTTIF